MIPSLILERKRAGRASLAIVVLMATAATTASAAARYQQGQEVVVSGIVSDLDGRPLPGLEIVLSGHRDSFDVWAGKRRQRGESSLTTTTDKNGGFTIIWRWDKFYNRFAISAGIRQTRAGEEEWWRVAEEDLTRSMRRGSPVVANLLVENAEEVRGLQAFLATLGSDDTHRVYQELGKPDKVQSVELPQHVEVTWWYFDKGMVYRFVDGQLDSSESFEPVDPFENTER